MATVTTTMAEDTAELQDEADEQDVSLPAPPPDVASVDWDEQEPELDRDMLTLQDPARATNTVLGGWHM